MKKLVFLCCFILLATNSFAEKGWHVEWYRIKRPSNEYGEFLGEENWSNINFNRSWKTNYVYGDIKINPLEIVEFQREIGSDIGVILDIPSRYGVSKDIVEKEVLISQKNIVMWQ